MQVSLIHAGGLLVSSERNFRSRGGVGADPTGVNLMNTRGELTVCEAFSGTLTLETLNVKSEGGACIVAQCSSSDESPTEEERANAERLVACWNAFIGIPDVQTFLTMLPKTKDGVPIAVGSKLWINHPDCPTGFVCYVPVTIESVTKMTTVDHSYEGDFILVSSTCCEFGNLECFSSKPESDPDDTLCEADIPLPL